MTAVFTTGMEIVALVLSIGCLIGIAITAYVHPSAWQVQNYRFTKLTAMAGNLSFSLLIVADMTNWERVYLTAPVLASYSLLLCAELAWLLRSIHEAFAVRSAANGYKMKKLFESGAMNNGRLAKSSVPHFP